MMEFLVALKWPLLILQLILAPVLVMLVLLQSGKGDDIGAALSGGGGSGSVLGTGGASKVLVKATVIFAILFMVNSVVLAKVFKVISGASVTSDVSEPLVPAKSVEDSKDLEGLGIQPKEEKKALEEPKTDK